MLDVSDSLHGDWTVTVMAQKQLHHWRNKNGIGLMRMENRKNRIEYHTDILDVQFRFLIQKDPAFSTDIETKIN